MTNINYNQTTTESELNELNELRDLCAEAQTSEVNVDLVNKVVHQVQSSRRHSHSHAASICEVGVVAAARGKALIACIDSQGLARWLEDDGWTVDAINARDSMLFNKSEADAIVSRLGELAGISAVEGIRASLELREIKLLEEAELL